MCNFRNTITQVNVPKSFRVRARATTTQSPELSEGENQFEGQCTKPMDFLNDVLHGGPKHETMNTFRILSVESIALPIRLYSNAVQRCSNTRRSYVIGNYDGTAHKGSVVSRSPDQHPMSLKVCT